VQKVGQGLVDVGNTLISLMVAGNAPRPPVSPLDSMRTLTAHIALVVSTDNQSVEYHSLFACELILFVTTAAVTITVRYLRSKRNGAFLPAGQLDDRNGQQRRRSRHFSRNKWRKLPACDTTVSRKLEAYAPKKSDSYLSDRAKSSFLSVCVPRTKLPLLVSERAFVVSAWLADRVVVLNDGGVAKRLTREDLRDPEMFQLLLEDVF
jgi:hypothetical protein